MSFLSASRSLISFTNPTETQFDTMRTALLNYFNAASMTEANLAPGGLVYSTLSKAVDDASLKWTSSAALIKYVSGSTTFQIENALGAIVWRTKPSATELESLRLATTGVVTIGTGGLLKANQGQGSIAVDTQWLLSYYRKPRLEYTDSNIITSGENGPNASESLLLLRDRLTTIKDRTLSLAATANGYDAAHVGASVSGLKSGLVRTANTWYYIYGVLVQGGTDNGGTYSVMVADTTSPVQANVDTLNTAYGSAKWVYLGIIRNGYNDGVSTNVVVPFVYDGYGNLRFTTTTETGKGYGIRFLSASSSSNQTYTLTFGTGATDLPVVATRGTFVGYRPDCFTLDYVSVASGEIQAQGTCCESHDSDASSPPTAAILLEVPFINGYKIILRVGSGVKENKIYLSGLVDHYV